MIIYTDANTAIADIAIQPEEDEFFLETTSSEETSIVHFCEFVDYYTRHSTDPLYTAAACEQQAEAIHITPQDATPENIRMLIDTMLIAIDHLEKKWLDEQIQREDLEQVHYTQLAQRHTSTPNKQKQERNWIVHLYRQGARWIQNRFRHIPRREVVAW